jgi:hypothetical protein
MNKRWLENFKRYVSKRGIDPQTFDFEHNLDWSLTYSEIKAELKDKLSLNEFKYQKDEKEHLDQEQLKEEEAIVESVAKEKLEEYRKQLKDSPIDVFYKPVYDAILKQKMGLRSLLFIKGRGGIGKSYCIKRALVKNNIDFVVISGRMTEAHLYRTLYENKTKTIWLKDIMRLFRGLESIEMLKAVTETSKEDRIVSNNTYSFEMEYLPKSFLFEGNLVFDFNQVIDMKWSEDFNALISRGELIELVFGFEEMCQIMRLIAETDEEKEATEYLIENYKYIGNNQFNLRTQKDVITEHKFAKMMSIDWKQHIKEYLNRNMTPLRTFLYQFIGNGTLRTMDLKKCLLLSGACGTLRTADRRVQDWTAMGELFKVSSDVNNPLLSLNPMKVEFPTVATKKEEI